MKHSKAYKKRKKGALKNTSNKKILKTKFRRIPSNFLYSMSRTALKLKSKPKIYKKKQRKISKTFLSEVSLQNIPPTPKGNFFDLSSKKNPAESSTKKVKKR